MSVLKPGRLFRITGKPRSANAEAQARSSGFLRITFIAGFLLLFLVGAALGFSLFMGRGQRGVSSDRLRLALREYDRKFSAAENSADDDGKAFGRLDRELDRMEKRAGGVDSLLSVLKRRRALAMISPRYLAGYREAALRASAAYPHSGSLAAVAAAALVQGSAISGKTEAALREFLPLLAAPENESLKLCLHILLGDMKNPLRARDNLPGDFSQAAIPYSFPERESLVINAALVKLVRSELPENEMQELLAGYSGGGQAAVNPSAQVFNLAAEYFYDFGDPLRAARLFSQLEGDYALSRQADALWVAGYSGGAKTIWNILANAPEKYYQARALYNLALNAESAEEAASLYGRLIALPAMAENSCREAGLIRYSRALDAPNAAVLLETAISGDGGANNPLVELELLRRRAEMWDGGRSIAALWLLLGRYPGNENLHEWGAWFFSYQRAGSETAMLLKTSGRRGFHGQWPLLYDALINIGAGRTDKAEQILLGLASAEKTSWEVFANLGRIYEARRDPARAIEFYEKAAAGVRNAHAAARIHLRIAACLTALGLPQESRRVLEYVLLFDPENLAARLELSRLEK